MNHTKLFRVLVMGGAMLAAGCETEDGGDDGVVGDDASAPVDASPAVDAQAAASDGGALMECGFCPNEECCVTDEDGTHEREGLMCCWGTSC